MKIFKLAFRTFFILTLASSLFTFITVKNGFSQKLSDEEKDLKVEQKSQMMITIPMEPEALFNRARTISNQDPVNAIILYKHGLFLKRDAWDARKELALLYEKQGEWGMAINEYETINNATSSKESYQDLIRVLGEAGYYRSAATLAKKAYEKHPKEHHFLLSSAEFYIKAHAYNEAMDVILELIKINPMDAKTYFILGSIYERQEKPKEAFLAYIKAQDINENYSEVKEALERIKRMNATVSGLVIFLPEGYVPTNDGVIHLMTGQMISIVSHPKDDPKTLAIRELKKLLPEGISINAVTKDLPHIKNAVLVKIAYDDRQFFESVAVLAVPTLDKVYLMAWKARAVVEEGEHTLATLANSIVWQGAKGGSNK